MSDSSGASPTGGAVRRHLGIGAASSLVVQVAPLVSVTIVSVVVARHIGPGGTGTVALLNALLEVLLAVFGFGLTVGITYFTSRGEWSVRDAVLESHGAAAILGLVGIGLGLAFFVITHDRLFAGISIFSALVGIGHLPLTLGRGFLGAIALARERYEAYASFELVRASVLILCGVSLTFLVGVNGALIGIAAGSVGGYVAATVWAARYARVVPRSSRVRESRLREAAAFGSKAWGATLLQLVNYRLDLFLLTAFVPRTDVGRYSVALSVTALAWVLPAALETVILPRTADLHAAHGRGEIEAEVSDAATIRAVRHSVLLLMPATALVLVLVVGVVPLLYGSQFVKSVWFGLILIPGVVSLSLGKSMSAVITGRGRPQYALWTTLITVPLTIVLYLALIPPLGGFGAALGSTISYGGSTMLAMIWFRRTTALPLHVVLLPSRVEIRDYADALATVRRRIRPRAA